MAPRPRDLADALGPALKAGPVPRGGAEVVEYAGGRTELVRTLTGRDHAPKRSEFRTSEAYEDARRSWRSTSRRVQRWSTEAGQRRAAPALSPAEKGRVRRAANKARLERLGRTGLWARLRARVTVATGNAGRKADSRVRDLPSGGPGVFLDGEDVRAILEELDEQGKEAAAEDFLTLFLDNYGMTADVEVDDVMWLKVWLDGDEEPA